MNHQLAQPAVWTCQIATPPPVRTISHLVRYFQTCVAAAHVRRGLSQDQSEGDTACHCFLQRWEIINITFVNFKKKKWTGIRPIHLGIFSLTNTLSKSTYGTSSIAYSESSTCLQKTLHSRIFRTTLPVKARHRKSFRNSLRENYSLQLYATWCLSM